MFTLPRFALVICILHFAVPLFGIEKTSISLFNEASVSVTIIGTDIQKDDSIARSKVTLEYEYKTTKEGKFYCLLSKKAVPSVGVRRFFIPGREGKGITSLLIPSDNLVLYISLMQETRNGQGEFIEMVKLEFPIKVTRLTQK